MTKENEFRKYDLVKYKASFLQSVGWYTDIPRHGTVTEVCNENYVMVEWYDRDYDTMVNVSNIMLLGKPDYSGM